MVGTSSLVHHILCYYYVMFISDPFVCSLIIIILLFTFATQSGFTVAPYELWFHHSSFLYLLFLCCFVSYYQSYRIPCYFHDLFAVFSLTSYIFIIKFTISLFLFYSHHRDCCACVLLRHVLIHVLMPVLMLLSSTTTLTSALVSWCCCHSSYRFGKTEKSAIQ